MNVENRKKFIINILYYTMIGIIGYLIFKYALAWLFPFILGFIIVAMLQPIIKPIKKLIRSKNERVALIILLLMYAIIASGVSILVFKLVVILGKYLQNLPEIIDYYIQPTINTFFNNIEGFVSGFSPELLQVLKDAESNFINILMSLGKGVSTWSISFLTGLLSSVPNFFITSLLTIISSFFIAIDFHRINQFILAQCSPKVKDFIFMIKDYATNTLVKILFAYAKLMSITFIELSIGFMILGVNNAFFLALLIAIFDVLPVLGTGGIMIPWMLYLVINQELTLAIGLLILYITITVFRNIIEPRIVGKQVGIHPLLMLMSMFVGVRVFGFLGLFICPITMIIIKNLNEQGKIHLYKMPKN